MSSPASVQCPITNLTPTAFKGHTDTVSCMDFFPDNRHLVTGSQDMSIRLWDIHTGLQIGSPWLGHSSWLNELAVSPDGSRVASCAYDQVVQIWSREGSVLAGPWKCSGPVMSVSWSPDGHHLACGLSGGNLEIRSAGDASDNIIMSISTENDCIWSVAYSPDGTRLATSGKNGSLAVWDRSTGEKQLDLQKHVGNVNSVCWSADGTRLISAGDDRSISIWHSNTGSLISVIVGHTEAVRGVVASPDGRIFASASWDGSLRLWSSTTFELIDKPIVHDKALYAVAISHDSVRVAFGGGSNGSVFVLDVAGDNDIPTENEIPPDARIEGDSAESLSTLHSDSALGEDTESTSIPPSIMDDIDKSIALSRQGNHEAAMQAIDLGFIDANGNADMIRFLMLIKSIIIFSTGRQDEGMARVLDLVDTRPGHDAPMCRTVQAYMYAQQGMGAVNENDYDKAITMFANAMTLGPFDPLFSRLQTISLIFEWKFDSLWRLIHQQKCEALRAAGRLNETTELLYDTMHKFDDGTNTDTEFVEWLTDFKRECVAASVIEGDAALRTENYDKATNWYSAAIALDPLRDDCFLNRSKARAAQGLWDGALEDAQQAIGLDPSSPWGFEMKHAALHALRDYDNAIMAFRTMLSKLDHAGDPKTRELRQKYVSPSDTKRAIQKAVFAELANAPLRLFNTNTGLLCDREAQIRTFETSQEFKELVSSITTLAASQADRIRAGVNKFFQYVMLSHRWEGKEPLLPDIQDKNVYTLDPVHTIIKLQKFCETARGRGYRWAWSDTCCIDKINNVELQKSLISMFLWYRNAALTITYLSDVSGSSTSGGLAESAWRTRGWILQEFLASLVVLFFRKDWTLYGDDQSSNHKEVDFILREVEEATGIDKHALANFQSGSDDARLKLLWASTRVTTEEEDIAYSLLGIFDVQLPVLYGEKKEKALGRLLQEVITQSGDIAVLDWIGKASGFNSCLPEDISSFKTLPFTPPTLTKEELDDNISALRAVVPPNAANKLYDRLYDLAGPRFANRRLTLPCIVHPVMAVEQRREQESELANAYDIKAVGLKDLCITTADDLTETSLSRSARPKYLLVHPWSRDLLDPLAEDSESEYGSPTETLDGNPIDYYAETDHRSASRLLVRLGQPFSAMLLMRLQGAEYKRIACDRQIIAQVDDVSSIPNLIDIRTLDIL